MDSSGSSVTDIIPEIIPCCYGKEMGVEPEIISTGLSAISIKRTPRKKNDKNDDKTKSSFENRNSFFNLHRPEMTKINWVSTSPRKIEQFFHDHATKHGPFCSYLHEENVTADGDDFKCLLPPTEYDYNEEAFLGVSGSMGNSILLKSCSMQLSDEDLDPASVCHRSRAEFCVTIGGKESSRFTMTAALDATATSEERARQRSSPAENEDSLAPLGHSKTRVHKVVRSAPRSGTFDSAYGLDHLATIGQSQEIATYTASSYMSEKFSSSLTRADDGGEEAEGEGEVDDTLRAILEPQEEAKRESYPNEMTEVDEMLIRGLQRPSPEGSVVRAPGAGTYEKKPPPPSPEPNKSST